MALKTCSGLICNDSVQFQMEMRKISRRRPRSVEGTELGHFTLLFRRGPQRDEQNVITHVHSSLYNTDGPLFGDPQNVLENESHEKFQHFRCQRKKSSLTSRCIVNGKVSGGINGFSSLIKFVKVSFTVDLACSSKRCLSHSAESNLDNKSPFSLLSLVLGFPIL